MVARTIELHTVQAGGALPDPEHFDSGSLWTLDIMLTVPGEDFGGGDFRTPECGGNCSSQAHSFGLGDALDFASHRRHQVDPVLWGLRRVLIIEFWQGEERSCAHRCLQRWGECHYGVAMSRFDRLSRAAPTLDDPVLG